MISRLLSLFFTLQLIGLAHAAEVITPPPAATDYPLTAYASVGSVFIKNARLAELGWNERQVEAFIEGVRATLQGQPPALDPLAQDLDSEIHQRLQQLVATERQARRDFFADPARLEAYMKGASKNLRMERTDSGLAYVFATISGGNGVRAAPEDSVVLSYQVTAADGQTELPQLNVTKKQFKVAELLPGLAEIVQTMAVGSTVLVILPPNLSYGTGEWPPTADPGVPLLFMVVLHQVIPAS
jgi:FKBP-type peptidyl-prolyl cis-trans isomerase